LQRATRLNPSLSTGYREYAVYLANSGRLADALTKVSLMYWLDRNYNSALEQAHVFFGRLAPVRTFTTACST
jgi:hypothetical protein